MNITGTVDAKTAAINLGEVAPRQLPYVTATMLTRLAADVREGFQKRLPEVFDRPTDFTLRGVWARSASARELESRVYFPESQEEHGKASREYMRPGVLGTYSRQQKKAEFLLTRLGFLPEGWVTTPGRRMDGLLDGHGNLGGSYYKQIINVLQLKPQALAGGGFRGVSARSQKAAKRLGVESLFFVVKPGANRLGANGSWLPPGVWKHLPGKQLLQVLKFVRKASYRGQFHLKEEAAPILQRQIPLRWAEAARDIAAKFERPKGATR